MVLKSLQLQGFKSFPDKTEIQFLGGMTAIVGPNGSGKSNISDAIRWVLGEQSSRSLRGVKMEDVIFGGTAKRGPVGFAEVSLILDNAGHLFRSDFTEIMVTRRYYRSGESEYFINKQHCRLKDIHELFMDTGLGRDGYSIIGQGRIDEILSLKSGDRREIFEEAAGITKFRYRKEEAERKLAATDENLVRIRDVYTELENQRAPLEKQAEKAKQYLLIRDELRVIEVSLWLLSLERLHADSQKTEQDRITCDTQLTEAKREQQKFYERAEALSEEMRQADIHMEGLRRELRDAEARQADEASRCAVLRANIQNNEDNIMRTRKETDRQAEQAQSLAGQIGERQTQCTALQIQQQTLLQAQEQAAQELAELDAQEQKIAGRLAEQQKEKETQENELFRLELDRTAAESALGGMEQRRSTIADDIRAAGKRVSAEEEVQAALDTQLQTCTETLSGAKNKLVGVSMKADSRRKKVDELTASAAALAAQRTDTENRIRMLEEMQREYEGFSRSVKMVMQRASAGKMQGIHGPVSSLITVPPEFVTAIETALGAAASHIVVDRATDGRIAIDYLKRHDGGRATFLPIDTIRPYTLREAGVTKDAGCCGVAVSLVQCEAPYRDILANLLGRTVVAENMDAALAIAKKYQHHFRIVTKDGQIIQAGGAMTGGSVSRTTGALARAGKLQQLKAQLDALKKEQEQGANTLQSAKSELAALDYDVKAIEAERARAQEDEVRLRAQRGQHAALLDSLREQQKALALERENLTGARENYENTIAEKEQAIVDARQAQEALARTIQTIEDERAALTERRAALTQTGAQKSEALAENRAALTAGEQALEELRALQRDMEGTLTGGEGAIEGFRREITRLQEELREAETHQTQDNGDAERLRAKIAEQAQSRMRVEGEKTKIDKEAQTHNDTILHLDREYTRLSSRVEQIQNEENNILSSMWDRYELTPTPAREVARELENVSEAKKEAASLKAKMRALGNVNLDAVEEFTALMERYTFLTGQKSDLERAQGELRKVIEQLTVNMKEIFASEFARLNSYFGETFRDIFGGGHAELVLEDTSDILNCGIEIRVSPPGKSLKTITLLSGGEKAFVAIALYFAILKVRPTPFCVLDEIEAALDDVNVARFAQYVRRLTDKTQFIVITHRRGTMEESDMLYGVTMQEQGVSKLLMLNLAEAEKRLGTQIK